MTLEQQIEAGLSHHRAGRLAEAEKIYRDILTRDPNQVDALHLLGVVAGQVGQLETAVDLIGRAIRIKPDLAIAHSNLGNFLKDLRRYDQAIASLRQAIALQPNLPDAHNNLGMALKEVGKIDLAADAFRKAIELGPTLAEPHSNLGSLYESQGEPELAMFHRRESHRLRPDYIPGHSDLVYTTYYQPQYDARMIYQEHRLWNQQHAEPLKKFIRPHTNDRNPDRRLRIGYVSGDLTSWHIVGICMVPLLREHDRNRVEVFCYSNALEIDSSAMQVQQYADVRRAIKGLQPQAVADLIRQDGIDILVDLALHSSGNSLMVFALKPAPIQVTYLGYCATTGLDTIDYRLSDPWIDPEGSDLSVYSEQTLRLPVSYWCYLPQAETPDPAPSPAAATGRITFGCLNSFSKVSRAAQDLWAEILKKVPNSQLILHTFPGSHRDTLRKRFADKGILPDQIEFLDKQPWQEYLKAYSRIDIALDPFPWGGGITTCDTLWMGVPVVTLVGHTPVGRGGKSILNNIGLPELIAQTPQEYIQIATSLAADLPRQAELRKSLRTRMQASPLMDSKRFARDIEAVYRDIWRRWCSSTPAVPSP